MDKNLSIIAGSEVFGLKKSSRKCVSELKGPRNPESELPEASRDLSRVAVSLLDPIQTPGKPCTTVYLTYVGEERRANEAVGVGGSHAAVPELGALGNLS